ncbi:U21-ctenitoxin-Pn1a-like [Uloborus diversus]|uniref:U21-ctenitoxin-Pn1a-like n=1 Tax=Uloborus diversus TaxID=327109 RepID=UPI002408FFF9|nr:U21-ctenitoxin-Pn1a-like [Uloborus diversus]
MKRFFFEWILLSSAIGSAIGKTLRRNKQDPLTLEGCGYGLYPAAGGDRIVGGEEVLHGQYPWMVSMFREANDFRHWCGATILNERWIITAAHCIHYPDEPWRYTVFAGLHKLSAEDSSTVRSYKISEIHIHENFDSSSFSNDIALLKTQNPIDVAGSGGYINGICLPKSTEDPTGFSRATGWGYTRQGGYKSDVLKQVLLPMVDRDTCNDIFHDEVYSNMICAGKEGRDTCQADSGGPLFQTDENGISTLIGITSFGLGCGRDPGVYTKVAFFHDWMTKIILN